MSSVSFRQGDRVSWNCGGSERKRGLRQRSKRHQFRHLAIEFLEARRLLATVTGPDYVYTTDDDFDQGQLVGVNHDAPNNDQLQLDSTSNTFPFINVAATGRGTVVRINTDTGEYVGEYRTAPEGQAAGPSRTSVDMYGNVWVANKDENNEVAPAQGSPIRSGSVTKIGLVIGGTRGIVDQNGAFQPDEAGEYVQGFTYTTCSDRNGDGLIRTSGPALNVLDWASGADVNGGMDNLQADGAPGDATVEDAVDECILVYQRLPKANFAHHVSVDANNDVWVGGYYTVLDEPGRQFYRLDQNTGRVLDTFYADFGAFGGVVDRSGVLWSADYGSRDHTLPGRLLRADVTVDPPSLSYIPIARSYGLAVDNDGFVWNTTQSTVPADEVAVIPPGGGTPSWYPTAGGYGDKGVAVTPVDNNVWVANNAGALWPLAPDGWAYWVTRLPNDRWLNTTSAILLYDAARHRWGQKPTGLAVDRNGKVWVTNQASNDVMRIDPFTNRVDLTVDLGAGAAPEDYSDMIGRQVLSMVPEGTWTLTQDSGIPGAEWYTIDWNNEPQGSEPPGSSIVVEARAWDGAATPPPDQQFLVVGNGLPFDLRGQYVQVRTTLRQSPDGVSPVLSDLRINGLDPDSCEHNDTLQAACVLGSLPKITLRNLTIHNATDVDYFQITAPETGKLMINAFFANQYGDMDLEVLDGEGNVIAASESTDDKERVIMPVVSQERYYLRVYGVDGATNAYDLEIENFAAPVPDAVVLDPAHDTGASNSDNVTSDQLARVFIEADLNDFAAAGISILGPTEVAAAEPGAAVQVFVNGVALGYAAPIAGTGDTLFQYTFTAGQLSTSLIPIGGGAMNFVKGAVRIFDGQHDEDGEPAPASGRTLLSKPLLLTLDTQIANPAGAPDLLASSDSGMFNDDNVTNIQAAAFQGTGEPNARVRVLANGILVGRGVVDTNGTWEVTVEPLADGVYSVTYVQEDLAGNISQPSPSLRVEVDTYAPNTALLDLVEASDTGRHNDDNVTNDSTPSVTITTEDPHAAWHVLFTDNLTFRIFDRFEGQQEFLLYNSALDAAADAVTTVGDGFTSLQQILATLPAQYFALNAANAPAITAAGVLGDGIHGLKLEVEDRAGNISPDFLLDVTIDTVAPPVNIIGIAPATTDTGVAGYPATFTDRVTSDTATGFLGRAEADATVRLYVDAAANLGINNAGEYSLAVAVPYDGDDAFPNGQWATSFIRDLNSPAWFPFDGVREVLVTAEDLAGNVNGIGDANGDPGQVLDIFIDTQGPQVTRVNINNQGNPYELFAPKPSTSGPTPLVNSLVISVRDLPLRSNVDPNFLYGALFKAVAEDAGNYSLVGDHNGVIAIERVTFTTSPAVANGQPAQGYITISFVDPLPDDRFTLTLSDNLVDPAGNALDGESNTKEPQETAGVDLPSGDGQPGGAFVARFTVDSRAEIAVWAAGNVHVDSNGNWLWDPEGKDRDEVNEDVTYVLGFTSDNIFAGNYAVPGKAADGFAKLAAYGKLGADCRWLIDVNNDGVPDLVLTNPAALNGLPAAGNFDGNAANGDEVALKVGNLWYLDKNHSLTVDDAEKLPASNMIGYPIVGDFDGDGIDDLGSRTDDVFSLNLSSLGPIDGVTDVQFKLAMNSAFIGVQERPIAADFDGDGIDDLGLWVPRHSAGTPLSTGEWYILISDGRSILDRIRVNPQDGGQIVDFAPVPFGADEFAVFGSDFALPVVGNFDPHHIQPPLGAAVYGLTNLDDAADVNGDGRVSAIDALILVNQVNLTGPRALGLGVLGGPFLDVNQDFHLTASDVLEVVSRVNRDAAGAAEGEAAGGTAYVALEMVLAAGLEAHAATAGSRPQTAIASALPAAERVDRLFTPVLNDADAKPTSGGTNGDGWSSTWNDAENSELEDILSEIAGVMPNGVPL